MSPNINRKPGPMTIGNRTVKLHDNPVLRAIVAAHKVRMILARRRRNG